MLLRRGVDGRNGRPPTILRRVPFYAGFSRRRLDPGPHRARPRRPPADRAPRPAQPPSSNGAALAARVSTIGPVR